MKQKFMNWTVKRSIGEGAFGKVYELEREEFGHTYKAALKVIRIPRNNSELSSALNDGMSRENVTEYFYGMVEKIVEEFVLMSKLKGHSNIVSYEDHYVEKNADGFGWTIYIRMELLTPVYQYFKENRTTVKDVIQLGIDICRALELCKKYHIVHRDIKPENIFVSDAGDFKLGDFGIARELENTASGLSKVGTRGYMAPEIHKGLEYNSTVDVYSLGIVLYRLLNRNRMPFMPDAPAKIKFSDREKAEMLRLSGQVMPKPCNAHGRLGEIVLKACAYHPQDRYRSAGEMRQALEGLLYSAQEITGRDSDVDEMDDSIEVDSGSLRDSGSGSGRTPSGAGELSEEGDGTRYLFKDRDGTTGTQGVLPEKVEPSGIVDPSKRVEPPAPVVWNTGDRNPGKKGSRRLWYMAGGVVACFLLAAGLLFSKFLGLSGESSAKKSTEGNAASESQVQAVSNAAGEAEPVSVEPVETEPPSFRLVDVRNLKQSKAVSEIGKQTSAQVKITKKYSDTVKKGYVIKQTPSAGETYYVTDDTENFRVLEQVSLTVSKGPKPVTVPDLENKTVERAKEILTARGLKVKVKESVYSQIGSGRVVYQSINSGTKVKKGTVITITPSKGAAPVKTAALSYDSSSSRTQPGTQSNHRATSRPKQTSKPKKEENPSFWDGEGEVVW